MSPLFQILSVIVLFQLTFISFFLLTNKKGRKLSNHLLAFFFLSLAAGTSDFILLQLKVFETYHQYAFLLNSLVVLHAPLLFLYVQSVTNPIFKLKAIHLLHSWGFLLSIGLLIPFYYTKSEEIQKFVIEEAQKGDAGIFVIISVVGIFYELGYLTLIKLELRKYHIKIRERFSNLEKINLSWLNYIINIFLVSFAASSVASFIRHSSFDHLDEVAVILALVGFFVFINSVLLKGLHQNEVFLGANSRPSEKAFQPKKSEELLKKLERHLKEEKPYLNPDLTINELAQRVEVPARELSALVNGELGQSFFDLINRYRIEEAKRIISETDDPKETILEVMYKVGFNSKSSFNTAFKKFTGTTPTAYKTKAG